MSFKRRHKLEEKALPYIQRDLEELFDVPFKDVSGEKEVDLVMRGFNHTVEVKVRNYETLRFNDILIETVSVVERNVPGWIYTSKAELLYYCFFEEGKPLVRAILHMPHLQGWWKNVRQQLYVEQETYTEDGWHTRFRSVPWRDIPDYIYHRRLGRTSWVVGEP